MTGVLRIALAAAAVLTTLSCGGPDDATRQPAGVPPAVPSSGPPTTDAATGTAVRIRIGDAVLTARLRDVPAARDLVAQLPLTLTFRDFNALEKISRLPRELSLDGVPEGDDPEPGDLGYYAPSGDLVLYYDDVGYFPGIVRLGHFDGNMDAVRDQSADFDAIIELA